MADEPEQSAGLPQERILLPIHVIRDQRVMLDADLASLYGVEAKALTRAIRRNSERFPADFMFRLSSAEFANLRRQFGTSSEWGGRRYPPYAFTEQGVAMGRLRGGSGEACGFSWHGSRRMGRPGQH